LAKRFDCLGLGIAPVDILMQVENYPRPGTKIDATSVIVQGGGPIPTAMVTVARLGLKPALIAAVGDDLYGDFVVKELKKEKVDASLLIRKKTPTAIAAGWFEKKSGRRTIALHRDLSMQPSDIKLNCLPDVRLVHFDGRDLPACQKLARWARRHGVLTMLDIGSIRNDVTDIIPLVDHLVCAEDFALPYCGTKSIHKAIKSLHKKCNGTVVITSGTGGSTGFNSNDGIIKQRAFKVRAVDMTGAGDSYHGAYIAGLLKGWNLQTRMKLASAVAALNCTCRGGRTGIPTLRQATNFIKRKLATYA
jgi:ribokinase